MKAKSKKLATDDAEIYSKYSGNVGIIFKKLKGI